MNTTLLSATALLLGSLSLSTRAAELAVDAPVTHAGVPDGSAGMSAGPGHFIGANDEDNQLRLYSADGKGEVETLLDLNPLLGFKPKKKDGTYRECDLEGAARIGDWIYWLGSHGTNKDGEPKAERQVFFATAVSGTGAATRLELAGKPAKGLLAALRPVLEKLGVGGAENKAPEAGGLNIESLCAVGDTLLLGLRGPVTPAGAIFVPLGNPRAVLAEGAAAKFGTPFTLDLGGRGVRDMAPWDGKFLIVGGDSKDSGLPSALYVWSGDAKAKPREVHVFKDYNPEALVVHGGGTKAVVRVLSDDGSRGDGKSFRSVTVMLDAD
jgi:hypothetical protein